MEWQEVLDKAKESNKDDHDLIATNPDNFDVNACQNEFSTQNPIMQISIIESITKYTSQQGLQLDKPQIEN